MVILRRNGIHLVIVTPSTGNGRCLEGFRERVQLIIDDVITNAAEQHATVVIHFAETIERGPDHGFAKLP